MPKYEILVAFRGTVTLVIIIIIIQNRSKCLLRWPLGLFSTGTVFSGEAGLIFFDSSAANFNSINFEI